MTRTTATEGTTPLRTAREELGWTQARAIFALLQQAEADGVTIADRRSLKTMLSRWENGRGRLDTVYQRLFCRIYGRDEDELGFSREPLHAAPALRVAPLISSSTVEYFRNVFLEHVKADNLMGPHHLVDVVRAQTALLDQVLPGARGETRRDLLYLAFRYSELTGWLYQDAGEPDQAITFTDQAMDYALEIDNPRDRAYVLMRKSNIACDLDKPDRALALAGAALRDTSRVPPRVRALIFGQQSRAHAALGNADESRRAIDQALYEVSRAEANTDIAGYCNQSYISMEAANALARLGKPDRAVPMLEHSLSGWPEHLRRDKGLCLARLASAYAAREDTERATSTGRAAIDIIRSATSARALLELARLRRRLAPWRRDAEVSDLCQQVRELIKAA